MVGKVNGLGGGRRSRTGRLAVGALLAVSGFAVVGTGATWVISTAGATTAISRMDRVISLAGNSENVSAVVQGPEGWPTETVALKKGGLLEVHLRESAGSTGYSWSAVDVPDLLVAKGDEVRQLPGDPMMVGRPSDHVFTFQAEKSGEGKVTFELRRSWMPASSPAGKTLILSVNVPS